MVSIEMFAFYWVIQKFCHKASEIIVPRCRFIVWMIIKKRHCLLSVKTVMNSNTVKTKHVTFAFTVPTWPSLHSHTAWIMNIYF